MRPSDVLTLAATLGGQTVSNAAEWSSSNTHVAVSTSGGVVVALAAGETDIRAVYQGQSAVYHAVVIADHISITGATPPQGTPITAAGRRHSH